MRAVLSGDNMIRTLSVPGRALAAGWLLAGLWAGAGEVLAGESDTAELDPIEVGAGPLNAADSTEASQRTGAVRTIEREAFANRITDLAGVLGGETGVQIRRTGGLGSPAAISIRGSSSKQVQVYLDGMLLNDPVTGGVDLGLFSLESIARIRTYPGNPPARFAQAGVGGLVALTSLPAGGDSLTRATLGGGSFGARRAGLFHSGGHEDFSYWLAYDHQRADNDFTYANRDAWFNPNDGATTTRRNAEFDQNAISSKLGYRLDGERRVDALLQWRDSERGVPTIQNFRDNRARLDTLDRRAQLHYQDIGTFDGRLHQSHRLVWSEIEEQYRDEAGRVGVGRQNVGTDTRELGGNSSLGWLIGGHTLGLTVDVSHTEQSQDDALDADPGLMRERVQLVTALRHEWSSAGGAIATEAAVRRYDVFDETETIAAGGKRRNDTNTDHLGWQLGGRVAATSWLGLYANLARHIRIPALLERFGQRGLFVGNPGLQAEEGVNVEIGARASHDRGYIELTGFRRDLDPAIVAVYNARGVGRFVNIAAEVVGLELEASYRPLDFWTLTASVSTQESENDAPRIADRDGKQLPGVYHDSARLTSAWTAGEFRLALDYRYDSGLFYDAANLLPADDRRTLGATLSWERQWRSDRRTGLTLEIRNATDELYQDFSRFPSPGRSYFMTLTQRF